MNEPHGVGTLFPLGRYCSNLSLEKIPADLIELAKLKVLDSIACAALALASDQSQVALRFAAALPRGSSAVLNMRHALDPLNAAFVNSVLVHALLQDDVDLTIGHPACNIIPAVLATGASSSGADAIASIVAGYEAMWRVAGKGAFMVPTIARGFRGNTIVGTFGASAAAARMLRLDAGQTTNAIAAAASFTAGLLKPLNEGSMERSFQQAANTQHGVMAAMLAANGLEACDTVLAGSGGLYRSFMGEDAFPSDAFVSLGEEFHMAETYAKPYPSAGSNTVGLAVLRRLLDTATLQGPLRSMEVEVVPRFTGNPGYPSIANAGPFDSLEDALISFPFGLACLAIHGDVNLATLREGLNDPLVANLAAAVELKGVEVPHPLWCRITVTDSANAKHVATSDQIDWSHFYLDRKTVSKKFRAATRGIVPDEIADQIEKLVFDLEGQPSLSELNRCLASAQAEPARPLSVGQ